MRGSPEAQRAIELRLTDLRRILDDRLSELGGGISGRVLEFISAAPTAHGLNGEHDLQLSSRLLLVRNALRQQLPPVVIERDQALCGNVDVLVPIDDTAFFVKGWMRDGEARISRLTAVTPEGERVELLEQISRLDLPEFEMFSEGPYAHPVEATWFFARFETRRPSRLRRPWVFEVRNEAGRNAEMHVLPDVAGTSAARSKILSSVPEDGLPNEELMSNHVFPAINGLQARARESVEIAGVTEYARVEDAPEVSIVVPLFRRIDLVEHQLLQFDRDPEFQAADLIYVLDSPELAKKLHDMARQLARLYRVPFRIVTMAHNAGFGAATNAGRLRGAGQAAAVAELRRPAGRAWLAWEDAGVPRCDLRHRGAWSQAAVRGRLAAARRPVSSRSCARARRPGRGRTSTTSRASTRTFRQPTSPGRCRPSPRPAC